MHTDSAVLTGTHHTAVAAPCQDFCLAGHKADRAWAVVADGCSTGGMTDLGARAWALAARDLLRDEEWILDDPQGAQAVLLDYAEDSLRDLEFEDGYSTLGILAANGSRVRASFFGDGALLMRKTDGSMTLVNLQFTASAPRYLNYLRHGGAALNLWKEQYPGQELLVTTSRYDAEGVLLALGTQALPADMPCWQWTADAQSVELDLVLVATDGVSSRKAGFIDTARELLSVKSSTGEFLRRRLGKLARQWAGDGSMPSDDLAVAGIWLGPEA